MTYPSLSRADVLEGLRKAAIGLEKRLPISRIILFGSYAAQRHTAGSDIDIVVVYKGPKRTDAYKTIIEEVQLPRLEPRVYTEAEFEALKTTSPKFVELLTKEGLSITGGEGR